MTAVHELTVPQPIPDTAIEKRVCFRVPGSTANLGPGFDALGLALTTYNTVTFSLLKTDDPGIPPVTLSEQSSRSIPGDRSNLIFQIMEPLVPSEQLKRVRIHIDSEIPTGSGLGSSGSATIAALAGADALIDRQVNHPSILDRAFVIEGHPDNVGASLYGGFVVGISAGKRSARIEKFDWPAQWHTFFVVPQRELLTSEARAVLPKRVPLADAVHNIGRTALLVAAVVQKDEEALRAALHDRLHEPYREHLLPELPPLRRIGQAHGALGCVLSGAGPTIMLIAQEKQAPTLLFALQEWADGQKNRPRILSLQVDQAGLRQING